LSLTIFSLIFIFLPYHRDKLSAFLSDKFFLIFAIAHGIHLAELLSYITLSGGKLIPIRVAGGALAYAFIFVMPIVIGKVSAGKQRLVENIYLFYIWLIVFMTYLPRVQGNLPNVGGSYAEFVILFIGVCILLVIRLVLFLIQRKKNA
jgi:heme exporter protein D